MNPYFSALLASSVNMTMLRSDNIMEEKEFQQLSIRFWLQPGENGQVSMQSPVVYELTEDESLKCKSTM